MFWRLSAGLVAICAMTLAAAGAAEAGKNKPGFVRISKENGFKGPSFTAGQHFRGGHFKAKRFHKHDRRTGFVKRRDDRRRPFFVPVAYYSVPTYAYGDLPGAAGSAPSYRPQASEAAPAYRTPPVTPKWVHVGDDGPSGLSDGSPAEEGHGRNCLSVKTQITIDGEPVDAFGEACLLADGSWELRPSEPSE